MTLKEMVSEYIQNTEKVFNEIKITQRPMPFDKEKTTDAVQTAKHYFEDAKYYRDRKKLETSLASVAYCEGLLDALRLLGLVEFSW